MREEFRNILTRPNPAGNMLSEEQADALFNEFDADSSGSLNMEEFNQGITTSPQAANTAPSTGAGRTASAAISDIMTSVTSTLLAGENAGSTAAGGRGGHEWSIPAWFGSLGMADPLAAGFRSPAGMSDIDFAKGLTRQQVKERLRAESVLDGLADTIMQGVDGLNEQQAATAFDLNSKFSETGQAGFAMKVMKRKAFNEGLEGGMGGPTMRNGSFRAQIEFEHCGAKDSDVLFVTPQTKGKPKVKPSSQWFFVIDGKEAATKAGKADEAFDIPGRNGEPITFYMEKMAEKNALLESMGLAPMRKEEIISSRLYSGPMYAKYNGSLRHGTGKESYTAAEVSAACPPFLQKQCETDLMLGMWNATADGGCEWTWHNKYVTTIHALNSAIIKLSPLSAAVPVYRGISGASLPSEFFEPDEQGVCGGVEPGFMSTTTDRTVAEFYAKVTKSGKASTVIEAEQGMIGRGADISWLSQFSHEAETVWPPRVAIEVKKTSVKGHSLVLQAHMTVNMTSLTLDQQTARRKTLVANMADSVTAELRTELRPGVHPGVQCNRSEVEPIEGNRYEDKRYGGSICEAEYEKLLGEEIKGEFKGPIAPLTPANAAARVALAEAGLRDALLDPHDAEWFNEDANYAAATAMPLMVKRVLAESGEAPMLRLLGCASAADLPDAVPPLEALQAVEKGKDDYGEPTDEFYGATRLAVIVLNMYLDLELLNMYLDPKVVWLGDQEGRTSIPPHVATLLPKLEVVDLHGCKALQSLPEGAFAGLTALTYVDLSGCGLTALPEGLFAGLTALTEVDLRWCSLTALPEGLFAGSTALTTVWLHGNSGLSSDVKGHPSDLRKAAVRKGLPSNVKVLI